MTVYFLVKIIPGRSLSLSRCCTHRAYISLCEPLIIWKNMYSYILYSMTTACTASQNVVMSSSVSQRAKHYPHASTQLQNNNIICPSHSCTRFRDNQLQKRSHTEISEICLCSLTFCTAFHLIPITYHHQYQNDHNHYHHNHYHRQTYCHLLLLRQTATRVNE